MERRTFLRLFAATTIAVCVNSKALASETSFEETGLQVTGPITSDNQFLWIMAQKFYDFAVFLASQYQVPIKTLFGKEISVQSYYDSLSRSYDDKFSTNLRTIYDTYFNESAGYWKGILDARA